MLRRLRYLLAEGFEVGGMSCYDAPAGSEGPALATLTIVRTSGNGERRLVSEQFEVTAKEAQLCSRLFITSRTR